MISEHTVTKTKLVFSWNWFCRWRWIRSLIRGWSRRLLFNRRVLFLVCLPFLPLSPCPFQDNEPTKSIDLSKRSNYQNSGSQCHFFTKKKFYQTQWRKYKKRDKASRIHKINYDKIHQSLLHRSPNVYPNLRWILVPKPKNLIEGILQLPMVPFNPNS